MDGEGITTIRNADDEWRTRPTVRIQVLHVPGCAGLGPVRAEIHRALTATGASATIEEIVGSYPSPTVLVDGLDVTERHLAPTAACRLDPPTAAQIRAGLTKAMLRVAKPT